MSFLPTIYLLPTHLSPTRLRALQTEIETLTHDINSADVVVGNITTPERARFELRHRLVQFENLPGKGLVGRSRGRSSLEKERVGETSGTGADNGKGDVVSDDDNVTDPRDEAEENLLGESTIKIVKLAWLEECIRQGKRIPMRSYIVYEAPRLSKAGGHVLSLSSPRTAPSKPLAKHMPAPVARNTSTGDSARRRGLQSEDSEELETATPTLQTYHETKYACERSTPRNSPNSGFVEALRDIRKIRTLESDGVGERAYSTAIAVVGAYPSRINSYREILHLPGCGSKIAELYREWASTGSLKEATRLKADPRLSVLALFYDIWGVGETTAREFYNKGWRDLDDVVEFGWNTLSRVQQIGVKYFDDFQEPIPRAEAKEIADTILAHARSLLPPTDVDADDPDIQILVVGGYRRGKPVAGDVDVLLSHPDESITHELIDKLVASLENSGLVSHTLSLSRSNSERDQTPLPWKGTNKRTSSSGFDTLDKAMVVWYDTHTTQSTVSSPRNSEAKRRRVDIIVSPWKTVGCAALGWTGDKTFERDLRLYCKDEKGWKFDSSGIRDRKTGRWVDLEGQGSAKSIEEAERRVFEGLGLEWRAPEERCTG